MLIRRDWKRAAVLAAFTLASVMGSRMAIAQVEGGFPSKNVTLLSWLDASSFGAFEGNDCWGYVSPSGREYALMGLDNQVAFVEITDPSNADWFASVGHPSNLWGDVKVYQDHAYIVTEGNSGIQIVDMSNIDAHVVTVVRTISPPSHSHNIAVDTASGYLYTTGRYMFDLSVPANPVEVGRWNPDGQHDIQAVTYTSGKNAGRQILFGASTGNGLDIIDVTDKGNTFLVSRTPYPNVSYCHQVWTEDLVHLYINDELDGINRTTVMDISDLDNPVVVGEYSSGTNATDHNNFVHNGFVFEADYQSGLRIFDTSTDPTNPTEVGWFDTYPANDDEGFSGSWSCYPFFPSGTVIISDRTRGLFVLDVSEAVGSPLLLPIDFTIIRGQLASGELADLFRSDDSRLVLHPGLTQNPDEPPVWVILTGQATSNAPSELRFTLETRVSTPAVTQRIELFNYDLGEFEEIDVRATTFDDSVADIIVSGDPGRFIDDETLAMQAQLTWKPPPLVLMFPWSVGIDQAVWRIEP